MLSPLFSLLLNAALHSAQLRVCRAIYSDLFGAGSLYEPRLQGYYSTLDQARKAIQVLADYCRRQNIDASSHPLFDSLDLKDEFHARVELGREYVLDDLTPSQIYETGEKGWIVQFRGWMLRRGKLEEMTDSYGQPAFAYPLVLISPTGERHTLEMPDAMIERARLAYSLIMGTEYVGDDGLGSDPEHPFERVA
ncbi:hypothetical protein [Pseudomonas aeruginosa]|uniref:hypothetical protein n=1 Tax=Pseudomonas aeruginosa TaxID=287 RepID=UPI00070BAD6F|nr:hypothetical protein [Pseudomonas aeruginosa]RQH30581.1 hypothetical protein IPC106_29800 [Pseudomonas aeruginosa]